MSIPIIRRWLPTKDVMPREEEEVLVSIHDTDGDTPFSYTTTAFMIDGRWISNNEVVHQDVTHWMPLPTAYGKEEHCWWCKDHAKGCVLYEKVDCCDEDIVFKHIDQMIYCPFCGNELKEEGEFEEVGF